MRTKAIGRIRIKAGDDDNDDDDDDNGDDDEDDDDEDEDDDGDDMEARWRESAKGGGQDCMTKIFIAYYLET